MVVVLLLGVVIRLIGIEDHDLWYDEALEIERDRLAWPRILFFSGGPDPPLFRLLMSPVARSTSRELWLRMPSLVFSTATIWIFGRWVSRLGDRKLALLTALLLAVSPVQVYYAQEVSQYAFAGFVGACLLVAMQRVVDHGSRTDWVIAAAVSVVAMLSYYGLLFLIAAIDLVLVWSAWKRRDWKGPLLFNAVVTTAFGVLWWLLLGGQAKRFASDALNPAAGHDLASSPLGQLATRMEADVLRFFWMPWSDDAPRAWLAVPAILAVVGLVGLVRRRDRWLLPPGIFVIALAAMWVAHQFGLYPFGFRYAFFLSPLLFLFVATGMRAVERWRPVSAAMITLVVVSEIAFLPNVRVVPNPWVAPPYENLASVLAWVDERKQPGDSVYLYYGARPAFRIYRSAVSLPVVRGDMIRNLAPRQKAASVRASMAGRGRFFLVVSHPWQNERELLLNELASGEGAPYRVVDFLEETGAYAAILEIVPSNRAEKTDDGAVWLDGEPYFPLDDLDGVVIESADGGEVEALVEAGFQLPWLS